MAGRSPQDWAGNRPDWFSSSTSNQLSPKPEAPDYMGALDVLIKGQAGKARPNELGPTTSFALRHRSRSPPRLQKRVSFREREDLPPDHDDNYYIRMDASEWIGLFVMNVETADQCLHLFPDSAKREIVSIRSFGRESIHKIVQFRTQAQLEGAMRSLPSEYLHLSPNRSLPFIRPYKWMPKTGQDPKRLLSRVLWTQVDDGEGPMAHLDKSRLPARASRAPEQKLADRISTPTSHPSAPRPGVDGTFESGRSHSDNKIFADPLSKGIKPGSESSNNPKLPHYLTSDTAPSEVKLAKTLASYIFWWTDRAKIQSRTRQYQTEVAQAEGEVARARALEAQRTHQSKSQPRLLEAQGRIDRLEADLPQDFKEAVEAALANSFLLNKPAVEHPATTPGNKMATESTLGDTMILKARMEILEKLPPQVDSHDKTLRQIEAHLKTKSPQQGQTPSNSALVSRIEKLETQQRADAEQLRAAAEQQRNSDQRIASLEKKFEEVLERSAPRDRDHDGRTQKWEDRHIKTNARIKALETAKVDTDQTQAKLVLQLNDAQAQLAQVTRPVATQYPVWQPDDSHVQKLPREHDPSARAPRKPSPERPPIEFLATKEELQRAGEKQRIITDQLQIDVNNLKRSGLKMTPAAKPNELSGHGECVLKSAAIQRESTDIKAQLVDIRSQIEDAKSSLNNLAIKSLHNDQGEVIGNVEAKVNDLNKRLDLVEQVAAKKEDLNGFKADLKAIAQSSSPLPTATSPLDLSQPVVDAILQEIKMWVQTRLQQMTSKLGEYVQQDRNAVKELRTSHDALERQVNMLISSVDSSPHDPARLEQVVHKVETCEAKLESYRTETRSSQAEIMRQLRDCNNVLTMNHKPMLEEIPLLKTRIDEETQQWKAATGHWTQELQKQEHRNHSFGHQIVCLTKWQDNFSSSEFYTKMVQAVQAMVPSDTQKKISSIENRISSIENVLSRGSGSGAGTPRQAQQQLPGNATTQGQTQQRFQHQSRSSYQSPQLQQQPYYSPQNQQQPMLPQHQQQHQ